MNKLMRKTAAVLMAAAVSATGLSATSFAAGADQCPHCGGSLTAGTDTVSVAYGASVAKPTYKIKGSKGTRKIRLSTTTSGATIYYTTDGSNPTTSSNRYTGLITVKKNTKIKAIAVKGSSYSSIMTKTVRVATVLGDVTGDGNVNESDYSRLISWIDGETSYGCKDNADVSGNGKVNRTDAKYLRQYLDGDIDSFPAGGGSSSSSSSGSNSTSSSIKKPTVTVYKSYGGKKIKLETETSGATIYYTTNGSDPTKNSTKYTGTFMLEKDATIKAVAYKSGKYSTVKSRDVEVSQCATPTADADESKQYTDSVKIGLSCSTADSRIYYTTDGSDPIRYGKRYTEPIVLTSNTTLKIFAEAKGYTNSAVRTYNYKVLSTNFSISGVVWNDTPNETTRADGIKQYGENGINGITVKLINNATNNVEQTVTTTTINGVQGSYLLDKAKAGSAYRVAFDFNGQKYRPFGSVVSGGNQAIIGANIPDLVIKNNGAFKMDGSLVASVNNLSSAAVSSQFTLTATTSSTYTAAATNVNLALASNVYGDLNVKFINNTSQGQSVYSGDRIVYNFTVSNDSPSQSLKSAKLNFYLDQNLTIQTVYIASGYGSSNTSYSAATSTSNGMQKYVIDCPAIEAGGYTTFAVEAIVKQNIRDGIQIKSYAEVAEYSFTGACFDKDSTPGTFTNYVRESDEAESTTVTAYNSKAASQTLKLDRSYAGFNAGGSATFNFTITNATWDDLRNITVTTQPNSNLTISSPSATNVSNGVLFGSITISGNTPTTEWVYFNLNGAGSDKQIPVQITVQALPTAQ